LFAAPYRALAASGPHAHRVFAFARGDDLITVVPRLGAAADAWRDTALALGRGRWRDGLTGAGVDGGAQPGSGLCRGVPTALLVPAPACPSRRARRRAHRRIA